MAPVPPAVQLQTGKRPRLRTGCRFSLSRRGDPPGRSGKHARRVGSAMTTRAKDEVTVDVPVNLAYNQWTQFEEFPEFMDGVVSVEQVTDSRLHWVAEVAGVRREWDAEILEQRPDRKVAWAATEGATNAGAVYFQSV